MHVRVDHGADAVYLNLTDRAIKDSEEAADGIIVDYDAEGRIIGVEISRCVEAHRRSKWLSNSALSSRRSANERRPI